MSWVKLDDDTYAKEATPDPEKILTTKELQALVVDKQREVTMYEAELSHLTTRKEELEAEILAINELIEE